MLEKSTPKRAKKQTRTKRGKVSQSGHPGPQSWRPEAPWATFGAPRGSPKLKKREKHVLKSPISRRPKKATSSLGPHLLPPRSVQMEPRSATRAAKGSKWGPFGVHISIKFEFFSTFFGLFCFRDQIGSRRRPEPPVGAKNREKCHRRD